MKKFNQEVKSNLFMTTPCIRILLIAFFVFLVSPGKGQTPKREFRGVWIATVANIDWPSKPGLSSIEQQKEFIEILEMHKSNGMNAVIVQVRPCADAYYNSPYEPWSKWLTGEIGKYPAPYYDPLEFMIHEAHQRGLEFHAWFNPY
ncbi:MAG TPA: family 10 glycosylhydrolase, partial [Cyclobacteriaceae bacterium]|nr:family 10 glycosylhydrolase [Cyclobacteriaceae bacterium]